MIKTQKTFFLKFFFVVLLVEAYFSHNYTTEYQFVWTTQLLGDELNVTAASEPYYWLMLNT